MPISERTIKHSFEYGSKDIAEEISDEANIVHRVTFKSLVGCIGQLSDLVVQSNEIFCELVLLTSTTTTRLNSLASRVSSLSATVESLPKARPTYDIVVEETTTHRQFLQVPQTQQLSSKDTVSFSMQSTYDSDTIRKMPAFHTLNPYKDCLMGGSKISSISDRYSHPKFFFNQWCLAQETRMKKIEAEKSQQKADKKARKVKQTTVSATDDMRKSRKKESISWQDRYIVNGEAVNRASIAGVRSKSSQFSTPDKGRDSLTSTPSSSGLKASPSSGDSAPTERDDAARSKPPNVSPSTSAAAVAASTSTTAPRKGVTFEPPKVTEAPPPPPADEDLSPIPEVDRDSDDDSDYDDEVDYRADPKYNLKKPLLIDISGADKGVFISPEAFTKMRTVSNATLRYSAVYDQHHVSSRVVKNTLTNAKPFPTVQTDDTDVRIRQQKLFQVTGDATVVASPPAKAPKPAPSSPTQPAVVTTTTTTATTAAAAAAPVPPPPSVVPAPPVKPPSPPVIISTLASAPPVVGGVKPPPPPPPPSSLSPPVAASPPSTPSTAGGDSPKATTATTASNQSSEPVEGSSSESVKSQKSNEDEEESEDEDEDDEGESNKSGSGKNSGNNDGDGDAAAAVVVAALSPPKFRKPPPPPPPKAHYLDGSSGSEKSNSSPSVSGRSNSITGGGGGGSSSSGGDDNAPSMIVPILNVTLAGPPPRPAAPPPPPPKNPRLLVKSVRLGAGLLSAINNARSEEGSAVGGLTPPKPRPDVIPSPSTTSTGSTSSSTPAPMLGARPVVPSFMDAIRTGSSQLKKVDVAENEKLREQNRRKSSLGGLGDSSVAAILERRKFLEAESSDDSDAEDDDWK